ncbi:MAG: hypothetical protein B7Y54_04095, partial [Polaromonas sp. 35-63-240]
PAHYVVVLVAPGGNAPGWVVQASGAQPLSLIPVSQASVPADKTLQFWTKGDTWAAPVSLGLVKPGETVKVPLDKLPPLQPNQLFELTLEPPGGSPTGRPGAGDLPRSGGRCNAYSPACRRVGWRFSIAHFNSAALRKTPCANLP